MISKEHFYTIIKSTIDLTKHSKFLEETYPNIAIMNGPIIQDAYIISDTIIEAVFSRAGFKIIIDFLYNSILNKEDIDELWEKVKKYRL